MLFSSLVYAIAYVAVVVTSIALSRLLSILLCKWLERKLKLTIIEYESNEERIALRTIITAMPDALVHSQTYHYKYLNQHRIYAEQEALENPEVYIGGQSFTWVCEFWKIVLGLFLGIIMGVGVMVGGLHAINRASEWNTTTVNRAIMFCVPASAIFAFIWGGRIVKGMRGAAGYRMQSSQQETPPPAPTEVPHSGEEKNSALSEAPMPVNLGDDEKWTIYDGRDLLSLLYSKLIGAGERRHDYSDI